MSNDFMVRIEFIAGTNREDAARQAIAFAKKLDAGVTYNFNGAEICAWPTSSEYALEQQYQNYASLYNECHSIPIPLNMKTQSDPSAE